MEAFHGFSASQTLITGVYRSGTEYITQCINSHPDISATMYQVNYLRFVVGRFEPVSDRRKLKGALDYIAQRMESRYKVQLDIPAILALLEDSDPITHGSVFDAIMTSHYLGGKRGHWAEKNQLLWREIPSFLDMMPNGKAILIIRDPRAVLASFKKFTYAEPPAYLGAIFNCLDTMNYARRYSEELPKDRFMVLKYEDYVSAPQASSERVWDFLSLEGTQDVTDQSQWVDAYGKPWHANSKEHSKENPKPFDVAAALARWQSELGPREIGLTEIVCREQMNRFGYMPTNEVTNLEDCLELFDEDPAMMEHLEHWQRTGEGIQQFPTDPLKPENWRNRWAESKDETEGKPNA